MKKKSKRPLHRVPVHNCVVCGTGDASEMSATNYGNVCDRCYPARQRRPKTVVDITPIGVCLN